MNQIQAPYDDEIDLREIIQTLLNGWKVILLLSLLSGAVAYGVSSLLTPVYEASAMVSIDQEALGLSINPANTLLSDATRQQVAEVLDLPVDDLPKLPNTSAQDEDELPSISVVFSDTGETLIVLAVKSEDARNAMEIANAWAEAGIALTKGSFSSYEQEEEGAQIALSQAEQALMDYLDANDLSPWSWTDLTLLTGIGQQPTILLVDNSEGASVLSPENNTAGNSTELAQLSLEGLPSISLQQRLEISQLMRKQLDLSGVYSIAHNRATQTRLNVATFPPLVLSYAAVPEEPVSPRTLMNTAVGIALGLMLGVFWVFIAGWWQSDDGNSAAEEEKTA